jgi:hypothetical protein
LLTTERLTLRRFTPGDLDWFAELYSEPDVARFLGGVKSRAGAEERLNVRILQYYDEHPELGIWMTLERATGRRVGFHLLNHIRGESIIQVGYALAHRFLTLTTRRRARWHGSNVKPWTGWPSADDAQSDNPITRLPDYPITQLPNSLGISVQRSRPL